jgi:hypothetical protein
MLKIGHRGDAEDAKKYVLATDGAQMNTDKKGQYGKA